MRGVGDPAPRSRRSIRILALAVAALAAAFLLRVAFWRPLAVEGSMPEDGLTRLPGVVHVHTTLSDGGGAPEEVVAAARASGLSFVILTDHNNLDAKRVEGYHGGLLVLVGSEISTTAGHLLGLGVPDPHFRFSGDARDALEDVRDLGGVAVVAHPQSPVESLRWTGWDHPGAWGLELLNGDSQWRGAGWARLLRTTALYGVNPRYALLGSLSSPSSTLARWDELLAERDVAGLVGADAHSRVPVRKQWAMRFPSYEAVFGLARTHLLLESPLKGDPAADASAIVLALGRGRSYVGLDALAPAGGFSFLAERNGKRWSMGDTVPAGPGLTLRAGGRMPRGARLALLRDGRRLTESEGRIEERPVGSGVYRVEARVPGWEVPWVLSNPIYVFDPDAAERRARRASWPEEPAAPAAARTLDAFEGRTIFTPEFDPSSQVSLALSQRGDDSAETGARMEFRLGAPGPQGPAHAWCALVNRERRDLSGFAGLVLSVKADGVYRLWVQVRDENPAGSDDGTETWLGSIKTSPEWRRIAVPFARLRSLDKHSDGRLDLGRVRALVLVFDELTVKPGTQGTIWLRDLGVY